jgi:uncharacterized protein (TIGR03083 family)
MPSVDPRRSLELLQSEVAALNAEIRTITAEQWQQDSNCGGWQVADLVSHVVRNGWSFLVFIRNAVDGADEPAFGPAVASVQEEIKASGPQGAAERQQRELEEFQRLVGGLSAADLQKTSKHPQGPRTLAWACTQRLAEVAFHHWDLRRSLGANEALNADLAKHLLPFMLDSEGTSIMLSPVAEGTQPRSFHLTSTSDGSSWHITVGPQGRVVDASAAHDAPSIAAEPGWLALALYGRVPVAGPHFRVEGPPEAAKEFARAFGGSD